MKFEFESNFIEDYTDFIINYLDTETPQPHINIFLYSIKEFEVCIDAKDFSNTIKYVDIMNEHLE
ncbi:hypothetical protein J0871_17175 [Salegentibacter sp. BDJ18]|uniref:hypothetical protein n=1 Tax=Salegentibacter sp. BDJ18 TaxID=2816376 RepID=UPI001AAF1145|nr:hypothetical protein [Salegentibacter sp. BDJ18]MBO2546151.1 hypothetical protein [Salegentibacter sp. BDJ18]